MSLPLVRIPVPVDPETGCPRMADMRPIVEMLDEIEDSGEAEVLLCRSDGKGGWTSDGCRIPDDLTRNALRLLRSAGHIREIRRQTDDEITVRWEEVRPYEWEFRAMTSHELAAYRGMCR